MTASNHTVTGALIGASISHPLLAIPIALGSHIVLDALPHFGGNISHTSRNFKVYLALDAALAASVLFLIMAAQPTNWLLMISCGVVAASPDLLWIPFWIDELQGKARRHANRLNRFLSWIQWGERPWGWIIEAVWFGGAIYFLVQRLSV